MNATGTSSRKDQEVRKVQVSWELRIFQHYHMFPILSEKKKYFIDLVSLFNYFILLEASLASIQSFANPFHADLLKRFSTLCPVFSPSIHYFVLCQKCFYQVTMTSILLKPMTFGHLSYQTFLYHSVLYLSPFVSSSSSSSSQNNS